MSITRPKPTIIPVFKAPKFEFTTKHVVEIPFVATVPLTSQLTILSSLIDFDFRITTVRINFDNDHTNLVRHYLLCSHNTSVGTTNPPPDENVFSYISPTAFLIGDNRELRLYPNFYYYGTKNYIKLHIDNLNAYAVFINTSIYIEEL